ncbi:MAG: metallopeptidase family protein [Eubacteriales bacterium]|nr:metallopeptidase family protein [Eubacteriales bacterium]MDD4323775.1 metallopeptidase family protein [Eubacteriales bacterium]MDD4540957.1 metallopeptidase family protein [Eubacteriales bacterium]
MMTLEQTEEALHRIVDGLPPEVFVDLNGGVLLREEVKLSENRLADDLYVLGEYHHKQIYGRYIIIYYGSLKRVYRHLDDERFEEELERVVKHELTHHLENRAKEHDLEVEDERSLLHYYARHPLRED